MATAISADRATMSQLTQSIATLTAQLKARDEEIASLENRQRSNGSNNNNSFRSGHNNDRRNDDISPWVDGKHRRDRGGYCWTHRYLLSKTEHTSANCAMPRHGHKTAATREDNNMGGSESDK